MRPHREATIRRMGSHRVVLLVQDTSELDFAKHPPQDARCPNAAERLGLDAPTHLAVTPDKWILGVLGVDDFDRAPETLGKSSDRGRSKPRKVFAGSKAIDWRARWRPIRRKRALSASRIARRIFATSTWKPSKMRVRGPIARFARGDRCTSDRDLAAGPAAFCKVRDEVSASQRRTTRTLELNATPHRAARTARLEVRARTVVAKPPHERSHLPAATLNAVLIEEVGGPGDGTAASWLLLASLPIETGAEILKVVD